MRRTLGIAATLLTLAVALPPSLAVGQHAGHGGPAAAGPAAEAYKAAMDRMMAGMAEPFSGDPDRDFARGMIPHHQAAIEMAQALLQHGKDPELRRLADDVIATQAREIAMLKDWLARNP